MCAFGDPEAKAIVNEVVEDVALKKGVKRTVEELVGDETFSLLRGKPPSSRLGAIIFQDQGKGIW